MTEIFENACHIYKLPAEILLNIFVYLPAKQVTKCREVCQRWKFIIDGLARSDDLWHRYCKEDFSAIYKVARKKQIPGLLWYDLYRSLSLWGRLSEAREVTDEFAQACWMDEGICNAEVLGNGIIGVHKKSRIVYYSIETMEECNRKTIDGDYSRYAENDHVIVLLSYQLHLFVIRKAICNTNDESNVTFDNVKLFNLTSDELYFVTLNEEIFVVRLHNNFKLECTLISVCDDGIMSLGYSNGHFNVLTFQRVIYSVINNELVYQCALGHNTNLLNNLHNYNFLEQLDWRVYFQWMYVLNHMIPEFGPLRDIIIIRPYGDVFFVGSNLGVLRIYYSPYSEGEFNIFKAKPIKQFNFMERSDCPVLCTCPILQVDILEGEDVHTVIVAMPKKIAVLNLTHNFKRTASLAMLPYNEVQKAKFMKTNDFGSLK